MRSFFLLSVALLLINCGAPTTSGNGGNVIGNDPAPLIVDTVVTRPVAVEPALPQGAVSANFIPYELPFYAYVKQIDHKAEITYLAFEDPGIPALPIIRTRGAELSSVRWKEFDRDLLMVNARLKDPNFEKYFLYVFRDGKWKPVVNGFAIHKSNRPDTLNPIKVNPKNPNELFRYYSVFDLDNTSKLGYTWRLLSESIPIENR